MLFACLLPWLAPGASILDSKHNLSITGPGTVKSATETDVCIFCHTVHKTTGQTPLWSHSMSSVSNYVIYSSPTLKATVGQPDGSSRLCLSCHDGTVALGMVSSRTTSIEMQRGVTTIPVGPSNLGTDLSGDHPISFVYDQNLATLDSQIKDPTTIDRKFKLDHAKKMQCVTCHDPHDNQFGKFLVMNNTGSALCLGCHIEPAWLASSHSGSSANLAVTAKPLLAARTPVPDLATAPNITQTAAQLLKAKGCENCHTSHKAGSKDQLLIRPKEEQNCFVCHNGQIVQKDLTTEFNKPSAHPVIQTSSAHNPAEDPINSPRHTACSDCHNSHAVNTKPTGARKAPGALIAIKGVNSAGAVIRSATHEYEICFRCHAESLNRGATHITRQFPETNKRLQFKVANQSFHPVESTGRNPNVPSLIQPWTTSSVMNCTDCHNNDQGTRAGGTGPDGPHGSAFPPILERQLTITDHNPESPGIYALCYKCHSRNSILNDQSFRAANSLGQDRGHRFHIVDQQTACTTCHDSHGVQEAKRLINFNRDYVALSSSGRLQYVSNGNTGGTCTLNCHGFNHENTTYPLSLSSLSRSQKRTRR
jgi:predicted CXXCH cytochrome family protein